MSNNEAIKPIDGYSEDIDWDVIYRTFHNPKDIAERIAFELIDRQAPMIFCGFPETAAYLATAADVHFVDTSDVITKRTKQRYPDIHSITQGDISHVLKDGPSKNIVISCRLSAFWQTQQAFDELASAILVHPRDQILIDFFDLDAVFEGMHIYFHTEETTDTSDNAEKDKTKETPKKQQTGDWDFKNFDEKPGNNPPMQIANIDISYVINDGENEMDFSYETQHAFFTKMAILNWCTRVFPEYETTLAPALLEEDPSFLVSLKHI